mgnify:CR=1 FL=1
MNVTEIKHFHADFAVLGCINDPVNLISTTADVLRNHKIARMFGDAA